MSRHRSSAKTTTRTFGPCANRDLGLDSTSQTPERDTTETTPQVKEQIQNSSERNELAKDILFIKNLRFLDLDILPDWPTITVESFKSRQNARLNQKSRLASAEWVLYRLFEKWDFQETKQVSYIVPTSSCKVEVVKMMFSLIQ